MTKMKFYAVSLAVALLLSILPTAGASAASSSGQLGCSTNFQPALTTYTQSYLTHTHTHTSSSGRPETYRGQGTLRFTSQAPFLHTRWTATNHSWEAWDRTPWIRCVSRPL